MCSLLPLLAPKDSDTVKHDFCTFKKPDVRLLAVSAAFLACHSLHFFLFPSRPCGILAQDESLCRLWHISGNGLPSSFLAQGGRSVTFYIPSY